MNKYICILMTIISIAIIIFIVIIIKSKKEIKEPEVIYLDLDYNELPITKIEDIENINEIIEIEDICINNPEEDMELYDIDMDTLLQEFVIRSCNFYNIDPRIMLSIASVESDFNPNAVGDNGDSIGMFQINKINWEKYQNEGFQIDNPYDNVTIACEIFAEYSAQLTPTDLGICGAIAAYNMGVEGAKLWYQEHPNEQPNYVQKVLVEYVSLSTINGTNTMIE